MLAGRAPNSPAAIAVSPYDAVRTAPGAAWSPPLDGPALQERPEDQSLMALPRGEDAGHELATPSARRCTMGLNLLRLRPRASDFGSLLLPQPRADGLGSSCHRCHGCPSSAGQRPRLTRVPPRRAGSTCPPAASGRSAGGDAQNPSEPIQDTAMVDGRPACDCCGGSNGCSLAHCALARSLLFMLSSRMI
jgi:hypothetical protein